MPTSSARRRFLAALSAVFGSLVLPLRADDIPGVLTADLKDQLEKGLRARLPAEFDFIARVVKMVEKGKLPLDLVKSTFQWARKKAATKRYPFPYFEQALRLRAKRIGIVIE